MEISKTSYYVPQAKYKMLRMQQLGWRGFKSCLMG
jgi:hypothetical protein